MQGPYAVNTASISYHETRRDEDESKRSDTIIKLHYGRASVLLLFHAHFLEQVVVVVVLEGSNLYSCFRKRKGKIV